jgi:hypothetical protein
VILSIVLAVAAAFEMPVESGKVVKKVEKDIDDVET